MWAVAHLPAGVPGLTSWLCLGQATSFGPVHNPSVLHSLLLLKGDSRATGFLWSNWNTVRTMPGIVNKHIINPAGFYAPCVTQFVHFDKFPECWACQLSLHGIMAGVLVSDCTLNRSCEDGPLLRYCKLFMITYLKTAQYWHTRCWSWICF